MLCFGTLGGLTLCPATANASVQQDQTIKVSGQVVDKSGEALIGATVKVKITLGPDAFEYYDESLDELSVMPGRYQILYGSSSRDKDLKSIDFQVI